MKNKLSLLELVFASALYSGQDRYEYINSFKAPSHRWSKRESATGVPSATQQANDFIVTTNGNTEIGTTTPDQSALMDVKAADKGILAPSCDINLCHHAT